MNIFFLSYHPGRCARWHCDKHVVKMILEYAQILYTAHHVNGGTALVARSAPFCLSTGDRGYKKHAAKHPSVLWASEALPHYVWLANMALCLCKEYMHRYKTEEPHSCEVHLNWLRWNPPPGLCQKLHWLRDPPPAMPDEFKVYECITDCYRAYYAGSKAERGLLKWTRRHTPHVFAGMIENHS